MEYYPPYPPHWFQSLFVTIDIVAGLVAKGEETMAQCFVVLVSMTGHMPIVYVMPKIEFKIFKILKINEKPHFWSVKLWHYALWMLALLSEQA
jgi:hypothetical protein